MNNLCEVRDTMVRVCTDMRKINSRVSELRSKLVGVDPEACCKDPEAKPGCLSDEMASLMQEMDTIIAGIRNDIAALENCIISPCDQSQAGCEEQCLISPARGAR